MPSLSASIAYLLFQAVALLLFLTGVATAGARDLRLNIVLAAVPIACVDLRTGQNGLLTAGLAAHSARAILAGRSGLAGAVAGLLTLKPQVALRLPIALVLRRDLRGLSVAAVVAACLLLASLVVFGMLPWAADPAALAVAARVWPTGPTP